MILPDSNVFIYGLGKIEPWQTALRFWIEQKLLFLSVVVVAEFLSGGTSRSRHSFQLLLNEFPPVDVNLPIGIQAAAYRRRFGKVGYSLKLPDALIAATAKVGRADLVTNNPSHYPMTDIKILDKEAVVRWMKLK